MIEYNFTPQQAEELTQKALEAYIKIVGVADKNNGKINDGEVFTPHNIVCDMCNLANAKLSDLKATVLEPACGSGNILIEILRRKLATALVLSKNSDELQENMLWAVKSIYGIDIALYNVLASRRRMYEFLENIWWWVNGQTEDSKHFNGTYDNFYKDVENVLTLNIIWGDSIGEYQHGRGCKRKGSEISFISIDFNYSWGESELEDTVEDYSSFKDDFVEPLVLRNWTTGQDEPFYEDDKNEDGTIDMSAQSDGSEFSLWG